MKTVGVLALQGDFEAHARMLRRLGCAVVDVRRPSRLDEISGLVMPGGESTTLLNLMQDEPWFPALRAFHARGGAIFATCAGAILLAREVRQPRQQSLGLLDATIVRNGYGRQIDSFETELRVRGLERPIVAVFIRAPRFTGSGVGVETLAEFDGEPVLLREGKILAGTFHPELTDDPRLHRLFVDSIEETERSGQGTGSTQPIQGDGRSVAVQ